MDTKTFLEAYQQLSEEDKAKIFTEDERKVIEAQISFYKLFSDPEFYKTVCETMGGEVYEELRKED